MFVLKTAPVWLTDDKIALMKNIMIVPAVLALCFSMRPWEQVLGADFKEIRLSDRVLILQHGPWDETMTVINAGPSLIIVDTWGSPAAARKAALRIEEVFHKPVRFIINTHYHWDHTFGNAAFPGAEIVGHRSDPEDMRTDYGSADARKSYFKGDAEDESLRAYILDCGKEASVPDFPLVLPTRLMDRRGKLQAGNVEIRTYHTPGIHTRGNLTIFIPELGLVFGRREFTIPTGLKLEKDADPLIISQVLEEILLSGKPVHSLIPGHYGPVENPDFKPAIEKLKSMK
jgi:glyoxylase-like metal-dependent hydrolase (beta-lactamase superfamily II)